MADDAQNQDSDALPFYDPLILYGSCEVAPNSASSPNSAALGNPHSLPMEILEIRFRIYGITPGLIGDQLGGIPPSFFLNNGLGIGVKLDLGTIPIVDARVPVNGFGTIRDAADNPTFGTILSDPSAPLGESGLANPATYTWRLKYPLFIPANTVLVPVFEHLGQSPLTMVVDTLYVARSLPENYQPPASIKVPWVTSYVSKSFDETAGAIASTDSSSELNITNPFQVPVEISRLVGSMAFNFNQDNGLDSTIQEVSEDWEDHRFRLTKVTIRSSRGDELARSPTKFNLLFPFDWRAWDVPSGWWMRPGEYYKILVVTDALDYVPNVLLVGQVQFGIVAVGYREIDAQSMISGASGSTPT